jgi:hypothetical protein
MLKAEAITKLKSFGLDTDKLIAAITNEAEVDFETPEVTVLKPDELTARDANTKAEGKKDGFKEGKEAGLEIAGKAIVKKFNLEGIDPKDPDKIVEALNTSVAKGDDGLKEQIKLLQKDKETIIAEKETAIKEAKSAGFERELISFFPPNRTTDLSDNERLMLVKGSLQFEEENGIPVVKKGGEVLRDPVTKNPLPYKDAINTLFAERKWVAVDGGQGGRGGKDIPPGGSAGIKKFTDAEAKWKADNPTGNTISPEFSTFVGELAKATTDFDWNS